MALIYDARFRAEDNNGVLIPGATLTVYLANTTTLASVFTTTSFATPLTNPVVADANGWFPQIFAPLGSLFDLILKDAGGVTIKSYLAVDALGTDSGGLVRTFAAGRFSVNSGDIGDGTIGDNLESGYPSPTNTGGVWRIGGWAGTRADRLDLDATIVNLKNDANVLGRLKEKGKVISEVVDATYTVAVGAPAATMIIPLTDSPTNVRSWEIDLIDVYLSGVSSPTTSQVKARFSYDGGVTYIGDAGGSSYTSQTMQNFGLAAQSTGQDHIRLFDLLYANFAHATVAKLTVVGPTSLMSDSPTLYSTAYGFLATGLPVAYSGFGVMAGTSGPGFLRPTHLKLFPSAGVISAVARVRPQRGFGE